MLTCKSFRDPPPTSAYLPHHPAKSQVTLSPPLGAEKDWGGGLKKVWVSDTLLFCLHRSQKAFTR